MLVVKGNKTENLALNELKNSLVGYSRVELDLGTGDGRFVYKKALENPSVFYIGVDPAEKQLKIYGREMQRKKLKNVMLVVGSLEVLPAELFGLADKININLPWGSLLKAVADPNSPNTKQIIKLFNPNTKNELEMIFGYSKDFEPSETQRLELPEIDENFVTNNIVEGFKTLGFNLVTFEGLEQLELREKVESTWGKKLGQKMRNYYHLVLAKLA